MVWKIRSNTLQEISSTCKADALQLCSQIANTPLLSICLADISWISELEFEWIRQFWLQGSKHATLNTFWYEHIIQLEDLWKQLESNVRIHLLFLDLNLDIFTI